MNDPNDRYRYEGQLIFDDEDDGDFEDPGDDDDEEDWMANCSMDRNGDCGQAGSEYCEFECPMRNLN